MVSQNWRKYDYYGAKVILKTFNENFRKYSLESIETLVPSQK